MTTTTDTIDLDDVSAGGTPASGDTPEAIAARRAALTYGDGELEAMLATGATYRRIDYWTRRGFLRPQHAAPGSGYARTWPDAERAVCALMVRLTAVGLDAATAADVARQAVDAGTTEARLGDGVHIAWTPRSLP